MPTDNRIWHKAEVQSMSAMGCFKQLVHGRSVSTAVITHQNNSSPVSGRSVVVRMNLGVWSCYLPFWNESWGLVLLFAFLHVSS
jgi:hypothetical protein